MNTASFDFTDAAVVVTGGTSGIGNAVATAFAQAGARVTITGTRATADDYDADLGRFEYRPLEITDPASVDALVASLDQLDVLVNNAGRQLPRRARRVGARDLRHRDPAQPQRPDAAHHGVPAPARRQHARRRGERRQRRVDERVPLGPARARLRIGQGRARRP